VNPDETFCVICGEPFVEAPAREMLGDLSNWKPTGLRP
jgi:hypothetical protein